MAPPLIARSRCVQTSLLKISKVMPTPEKSVSTLTSVVVSFSSGLCSILHSVP